MAGDSVCPRNEKISVKHKNDPFKGPLFELADFDHRDIAPSENDKCSRRNSDPQSSEMVSTADLISAVGYAWSRAKKPLSVLLHKTNSTRETKVIPGGGVLHYSTDEGAFPASNLAYDQPCPGYLNSKRDSGKVQENVENLKVNQKVSWPQPCYENFPFRRIVLTKSTMTGGSSIENCLLSTGIPPNLRSAYGWMSEIALAKQKNQVNSVKIESKRTSNYFTCDCSPNSGTGVTSGISTSKPEIAQPLDSFREAANLDLKTPTTTCSENDVVHGQHIEETDCKIFTSRCDADSQDTNIASSRNDLENSIEDSRNGLHEHHDQKITFVQADSSGVEISLSGKGKPVYALAKQEHAVAGAMAGIFVSLCLHPMDTVKTVIQSCRADQKPLHSIGKSIIAERGMLGLYRGISSNILSSAPISAVYTFTYESVKKSLIPLLPRDHHSLAHCTAGGCASIATSFIFTPSERIKQQMQVGSHYRNCWNALIQVVQKGGFPSLYAGWGAVLCRNVPHSVIKFYTYESLKPIMSPSIQSNAQTTTLVTLVCGGLAGSMASLFTTPFDVVKTRLQTQIPGSTTKYNGVFYTLKEIGKHEGLKGLYRGLTPRLVMYMVQGALFFASYESFKRLFSLEVPQLSA
ncbi:Mitoferrin [Sesamum alatum]|uniref:Mitoferrin n=1 Tax=Sesamum alatum TaxID=300844 RepID=A0AAE2CUW1_9LAMI|nr:Mitoferrin [Sesamum alatum]